MSRVVPHGTTAFMENRLVDHCSSWTMIQEHDMLLRLFLA